MSDILIVDDERDIRELIGDILEDEGYTTREIKLSVSINISPLSIGCNPAIDLNSVVFPVPLPPVNEMNWPDDRVKFKPSKRLTPPRETLKLSTDNNMHNT